MRPHLTLAFLLALGGLAGVAQARDTTIGVSVQVVDRRPASALLDAIPVPEQARMFDANGHARSYAWAGTPDSAAAFFESEMPRHGYRALALRGEGPALQQLWASERGRVVVRLDQAMGGAELTRIRINVGAARAAATSTAGGGSPGATGDVSAR